MTKKYRSKVSYVLLIFVFLVFYGPLLPILMQGELNGKVIWTIGLLSLVFAFVLHMFLKTEYIIDNSVLKIKCGLFTSKPIEIKNIKEVSKTNSIISAPAPSFDRIKIKYGKFNEIIISPKNKIDFANDLIKTNSNIKNNIAE